MVQMAAVDGREVEFEQEVRDRQVEQEDTLEVVVLADMLHTAVESAVEVDIRRKQAAAAAVEESQDMVEQEVD